MLYQASLEALQRGLRSGILLPEADSNMERPRTVFPLTNRTHESRSSFSPIAVDLSQHSHRRCDMKRIMITAVLSAFTVVSTGLAEAADVFVFPKNAQTKEQQEQDEFSCYKWAKEQTGFDPNKPVEQASAPAPKGGAVSGAAKGAAVGAIGKAIGGDAGKGAAIGAGVGAAAGAHKRRKGEKQQAAAQEQAAKQQEASVEGYQRAFGACMEGKGYTVK